MIYKGTRVFKDDNNIEHTCGITFLMSDIIGLEEFVEPFFNTSERLTTVYLKTHNPIIVESYERMHELWTQFLKGTTFYVPNTLQ